ncbi:MAG: hypothetical protein CL816_07115 [Coxiellaceae bacterium]|mgnify:CR=1 FL=1|nr:hypothetical protein [Coxiellaceae bacterium]
MKKYATLLIVLGFSFAVNVSVMAWHHNSTNVCNGMAVNSEGVSPCSECGQNVEYDLYQGGCATNDNDVCDARCSTGTYAGCYCDCNSSC